MTGSLHSVLSLGVSRVPAWTGLRPSQAARPFESQGTAEGPSCAPAGSQFQKTLHHVTAHLAQRVNRARPPRPLRDPIRNRGGGA